MTGLVKLLRSLGHNRRGQSAIEFALLLPLLVVLIAATNDLGQAVKRKVNQIAESAAYILPQERSWTPAQLGALFAGTNAILAPFDSADLSVVIAVVNVAASGSGQVRWSKAFQGAASGSGTTWPDRTSPDVVDGSVQLAVARVEYSMQTSLTELLSSVTGVSHYSFIGAAIARPRIGNTIERL